jgi:signal transduction histidine kinase
MSRSLRDWRDELLAVVPAPYAVIDPADGRLLQASPEFVGIVGAEVPELVAAALANTKAETGRTVRLPGRPGSGRPSIHATVHEVTAEGGPAALVVLDLDHHQADIERLAAELAEFPRTNPGPVLRLDAQGRVDLANDAALRLFGRESLVGESWPQLCAGITAEFWGQVIDSSQPLYHETDVRDRRISFAHVWQPRRAVVFVFGSDVTQLRRQERELAEQARFPDMNPGPVLRLDLSGTVLLSNVAARELLPEARLGARWRDVCPAVDEAFWARVLDSDRPLTMDATVRGRDYQFTHRLDPGRYVFVYGADVTDQRQAERAMRDSERMATLGTLAAGVAHELNNPAAAARRASAHLRESLTRLTAVAQAWAEVDSAVRSRPEVLALQDQAGAASGRPPEDPLARMDLEDDVASWLRAHGAGADAAETARQWVSAGLDRSALTVLADVAGPSALAIVGRICALAELGQLVDQVERSTVRVNEIALALKRYTYLGQAEVMAVDIHQGLEDTLLILGHKMAAGPRVRRELEPALPTVWGIGSELNQVWMNLLDNAIDAAGPTGSIVLRTRSADASDGRDGHDGATRRVVVEVEDDGAGVPAELRERIFEPFFTTKPPGSGTGLGLATTRSIVVDRHRGTIELDSTPGCTRFVVTLPTHHPASSGGAA